MLATITVAALMATAGAPEKYFPDDFPRAASAWRRRVRGAPARYRWARLEKGAPVVASPVERVVVAGRPMVVGRFCLYSLCPQHYAYVLFTPDGRRIVGRIRDVGAGQGDTEATVQLGHPTSREAACLAAAWSESVERPLC